MSFLYLGYLALTFAGALAIFCFGKLKLSFKQKKAILFSLVLTTVVFTLWDVMAIWRNHWQFGLQHTLGVMLYNQPLEEIGFFLIIPFFGLMAYQWFKQRDKP